MKGYGKLCTEFYDLTKPWASDAEIIFYKSLLDKHALSLEAMCGTGRLLLPLSKEGFNIQGVDNSKSMLDLCREKAKAKKIEISIFNGDISTMCLRDKYHAIFIALGSFQLLHPRKLACQALENLRKHLHPNGKLIIDTFIPWDAICQTESSNIRTVNTKDDCILNHSSKEKSTNLEQYSESNGTYEKIKGNRIIQREEETLFIHWYYKYEFEMLLKLTGFQTINLHEVNFELNPNGLVYEALL